MLAEGSDDAQMGVHPSCPVAGAAVGQPADTEGRMLEGEGHVLEGRPGSLEVHGSSPPQATKEQPANSQTRGDDDATKGRECNQGMAVLGSVQSSDT